MLDELPNKAELFELNTKNFDIKNTLKGDSQRGQKHRFDFHVISIGQKSKDSYKNIAVQLKQGSIIPPALNLLNKMQRGFPRNNVRRMITDTIINNRDIYDEAIKKDNSRDANASATAPTSPTKNNTNNNNLDPHPSMPTPSPSKKAHIGTLTNDGITSHQPIVNAGSDGKYKYDLVGKALGKDPSLVGDTDLDRLIMQAVALKKK